MGIHLFSLHRLHKKKSKSSFADEGCVTNDDFEGDCNDANRCCYSEHHSKPTPSLYRQKRRERLID